MTITQRMHRIVPDRLDEYGPPGGRRVTLRSFHAASVMFCRGYHRLRLVEPLGIPTNGPAIVVANHTSGLDPMLIQSAIYRPIVWMVARDFVEFGPLRPVFRLLEAIPVDRNGRDAAATRAAMRALRDGRVLGVFPEGRIEPDDHLLPFQPGVALLSLRTGATPMMPVFIHGTLRRASQLASYLLPQEITLRRGRTITPGPGETAPALAGRLRSEFRRLRLKTLARDEAWT